MLSNLDWGELQVGIKSVSTKAWKTDTPSMLQSKGMCLAFVNVSVADCLDMVAAEL